jgi:hypothetical protein
MVEPTMYLGIAYCSYPPEGSSSEDITIFQRSVHGDFFLFFSHRFAYRQITHHESSSLLMKAFGLGVYVFKLFKMPVEVCRSFC